MTRTKNLTRFYYILIGLIIFFTTSDLASGFAGQSILATTCSIISMLLVFWGYFSIKRQQTEKHITELTSFIKGNFDKWQIVLSILDVVCSFIVVFTSVMALGIVFRSVILFKILFTPAKIVTISNKFKTVAKPLLIFCFIWVFIRLKNKVKEYKMSNIKLSMAQKIFMIVAFVLGVAYTVVSTVWLPQIAVFEDVFAQIGASLGGTASLIFGAFLKGKEMSAEEIAKRDEKVKAKKEAEEKKEAERLAEIEKAKEEKLEKEKLAKAQALIEERKKKAEEEAKIAEEKAREEKEKAEIEALANKLEAESK